MKIDTSRLVVAAKVLKAVRKALPKDREERRLYLEAYSNGREQGYRLKVVEAGPREMNISFSENRNSDNIVVYMGYNFAMQGNVPSEEAYRTAHCFDCGEYDKTAKFIVDQIKRT